MAFEEFEIITYDKLKIFAVKSLADTPKANIIIVHGLGEHSGRYAQTAATLNIAGFNVYGYDHRGHGKSEGARAYIRDFHDYLKDLYDVIAYVKKDSPNIKNYILGHSMGGFIAALFGITTKNEIDGMILSAALTQSVRQTAGGMRSLVKMMGRISPKFSLGNDLGKIVSKDPNVTKAYMEDMLNCKKITMGLYNQFLIKGIDFVKAHANEFQYPVLILHGENDLIIDYSASKIFYENISSQDKTLKTYPGLYHEIMNEPEKETVMHDIIAWLNDHK